jgi:hypothetical protein
LPEASWKFPTRKLSLSWSPVCSATVSIDSDDSPLDHNTNGSKISPTGLMKVKCAPERRPIEALLLSRYQLPTRMTNPGTAPRWQQQRISSSPNVSISLPQIYHTTGTVPERSDAERIGLIPELIRPFPSSLFSTAHAHLQVQPQSPPNQGRVALHVINRTGLEEKGTCSKSIWGSSSVTPSVLKQGACLKEVASEFGRIVHLRGSSASNKRSSCRSTSDRVRTSTRSLATMLLAALAARVGEITVAQPNAESRDFASTIEMKCFDQRGLESKDI